MKKWLSVVLIFTLLLSGCSSQKSEGIREEEFTTPGGETGWIYLPEGIKTDTDQKKPLVLMTCAVGEEPAEKVKEAGWFKQAEEAGFMVLVPKYKTTETFSQTGRIMDVVNYAIQHYPVDTTRIYATGFSNGGGAVSALANDYPEVFAAVSCMSWMIPLKNPDMDYEMPFQVIQGSEDLTLEMDSGSMRVMDDVVWGIESMMRYNHLLEKGEAKDFDKTEYWGYEPDKVETGTIDGRVWTFSNYYKDGYTAPFAQFVLVEGAKHELNEYKAFAAWEFLRHYTRGEDGALVEVEETVTE